MEKFKGMCRDTLRTKQPDSTWQFARNILLTKGFESIANEDGFDYIATIPGIVIGCIASSEHKVFFSVNGNLSCIGYTSIEDNFTTYTPVIQSIHLGFKIDRPIEGIYTYNSKGELIIVFCDGVFENSNTPKMINLFNIEVALINLELVNPADLNQLELFLSSLEGTITTDYQESGSLEADVVYITYCYVLNDNISTTAYFPIHTLTYPTVNFQGMNRRNIILNLTELDTRYTKLKIGIVVNTSNGLVGYESNIINYNGTTYDTILSSLANFIEIAVDSLVIPSVVYTKIKTITSHNSEIEIGNLVGSDEFKFQKFANMLNLDLYYDVRPESKHTLPTLLPDEVYAFYISLQLLNGTYTDRFHIPGKQHDISGTDLNTYNNSDFTTIGLSGTNAGLNYKKFHLINSGKFKINTIPINFNNKPELQLDWGYWENTELYPNNDNYNSTIDYNGNSINGEDLRNTPIRYHRVPGLDALIEKFPTNLGYNDRNTSNQISDAFAGPNGIRKFYGFIPVLSVELTNFNTIVPNEILNKIQAYELSIVKRKKGDTLVDDINILKQCFKVSQDTIDGAKVFAVTPENKMLSNSGLDIAYNVSQFGISKVRSNTLATNKATITNKIVKANYAVYETLNGVPTESNSQPYIVDYSKSDRLGGINGPVTLLNPTFIKIPNVNKQYAEIKSLKYIKGNDENFQTLFIEEYIELNAHNSNTPSNTVGSNVIIPTRWNALDITNTDDTNSNETMSVDCWEPATYTYTNNTIIGNTCFKYAISSTFLNLLKNVYVGFKPKEFITIGRNTIINPIGKFNEGGDIFTSNVFYVDKAQVRGTNILGRLRYQKIAIKGNYSIYNNSEIYMTNDKEYFIDYDLSGAGERVSDLLLYKYDYVKFNKEQLRSLNDLLTSLTFNVDVPFINYFPYRMHRSLKIGNETIKTNNLRTFKANRYKEFLADRGEIIALRGTNKSVYVQQRHSLFVVSIKDKLDSSASTTFVGESDIFDRTPEEILYANNKGYIGCSSQFACYVFRDGYVTVDQIKGKIFIISNSVDEISKVMMFNYFNENWKTQLPSNGYYTFNRFGRKQNIDNPFTQIGHIVGFDYKNNRLLFTKIDYKIKPEILALTDIITDINTYQGNALYLFDGTNFYQNFPIPRYRLEITFSYNLINDVTININITLNGEITDTIIAIAEHTVSGLNQFEIGASESETLNNLVDYLNNLNLSSFITISRVGSSIYLLVTTTQIVHINSSVTLFGSPISFVNFELASLSPINNYINILYEFGNSTYFDKLHKTFSYSLDDKVWVCEHDYFPNLYIDNSLGLYLHFNSSALINYPFDIGNSLEYKHNSLHNKGFYTFQIFNSYVDLIFNSRFDLKKLYQAVSWITQVINNSNNNNRTNDYFKTINFIRVYTDYQCSDELVIDASFIEKGRVLENEWQFNNFRDIVVNPNLPIVNEEGSINQNNLNNLKSWFEKSNFINTFIVIRMGIIPQNNTTTYIHGVNVKSRTSDR